MKDDQIVFDKPGYDGRLNYHAILKQYMVAIAQASYNNNYQSWSILLRDAYGLVAPFIKSTDAAESKKEIEKCDNLVNVYNSCTSKQNQNQVYGLLRKKLRESTDNLYSRSKHLLLPVKTDSNDTFDAEEFMRGSDL